MLLIKVTASNSVTHYLYFCNLNAISIVHILQYIKANLMRKLKNLVFIVVGVLCLSSAANGQSFLKTGTSTLTFDKTSTFTEEVCQGKTSKSDCELGTRFHCKWDRKEMKCSLSAAAARGKAVEAASETLEKAGAIPDFSKAKIEEAKQVGGSEGLIT